MLFMLKKIVSSVVYRILPRILPVRRCNGEVVPNSIAVVFLGNLGDFFVFYSAAELLLKNGYTVELVCRKGVGIEDFAKQTGVFAKVISIDNRICYRLPNIRNLKKIRCQYAFAAPFSKYALNDIYTFAVCAETHILPDMTLDNVSFAPRCISDKKADMLVPVSALWEWDKYTEFLCGCYLMYEKVLPNSRCITKKTQKKYIAIFPGASIKEKMWQVENFAWVIKRLSEKAEYYFYIMGSKADKDVCIKLTDMLKGIECESVWNRSVSEVLKVLEDCCLVLTNDSGGAHMALHSGVPLVVICGMWQSERFFPNPSLPKGCVSIACGQGEIVCENCGKSIPNCTKHRSAAECIRKISPHTVLDAVVSLLDDTGNV